LIQDGDADGGVVVCSHCAGTINSWLLLLVADPCPQ
jgi:hypothetical protein